MKYYHLSAKKGDTKAIEIMGKMFQVFLFLKFIYLFIFFPLNYYFLVLFCFHLF